ncbi:hypothetical protein Egran_00862 [Elaphomyces granulatus]|uniref:ATP-dependent RNA helicase n=1 Tax=Elaphomyces granulatus TaxID=519963 RepID=A0A232M4M5_9EURO|nr:hypothetical protein Egran_00862 [Elaphomyces granulatus]
MLGAIRRGPVAARALRACNPRPIQSRVSPSLVIWERPSSTVFPAIVRSFQHPATLRNAASAPSLSPEPVEDSRITQFQELATRQLVNPKIIQNITKKMNINTMTEVQSLTIHETLEGDDLLAQAKTGTGKTIAFLIPVLQSILRDPSLSQNRASRYGHGRSTAADIRAIIISPTRELAEQIAVETEKLAASTGVIVQTAVGGTRKREGLYRIQHQGCHVLVGTPGRLKDILSDPTSGVKAPKLTALVLDEADRLLDDGFAPEIEAIQSYLPDPEKVDRQTLMFSATVPHEVMKVVRHTMKPNYKFVKTVSDNEVPTHLTVPQNAVMLHGLENAFPAILELVKDYNKKGREDSSLRPFKAIVYFNSTAEVSLASEVFQSLLNDPEDPRSGHPLGRMLMLEIHSRLTQGARTRSSDMFRKSRSAILFSSDVTARGMDFPDVTHVIQVGSPRQRESYIHRLGRTARANKTGEGWIFLHQGEFDDFRQKLGDLPISESAASLQTASVNMSILNQEVSASTAKTLTQIQGAMKVVPAKTKSSAFDSLINVLSGVFGRKSDMIRALNNLAVFGYGFKEPPSLKRDFARRLGLERTPGVRISEPRFDNNGPLGDFRSGRSSNRFDNNGGSRYKFGDERPSGYSYNRQRRSRNFQRY